MGMMKTMRRNPHTMRLESITGEPVLTQIEMIQEGWRAKVLDANGVLCDQVVSRLGHPVLIYTRKERKVLV
jgi:hypothetical protein